MHQWADKAAARERTLTESAARTGGSSDVGRPKGGRVDRAPDITLAEAVRAGLADFTKTERKVAQVLLSNYPAAGLSPVAEFATRAGVSAPTVLRFVARLGLGGYPEFQRRLRQELEARLTPPMGKAEPHAAIGKPDAPSSFADAVARNIAETFASIPAADFDAIVALLADPRRRLHAMGGRFTEALALYLVRHLRILRDDVSLVDHQTATWGDQVIGLGSRDVLVVYDIRRYQADLVRVAQEAHGRGATVVLFTDQWLSPIVQVASSVIAARVAVPSNWDSGAALLAVSEAIVAQVTRRLWTTARKRLDLLEALRADR